MKVSLIVPVFNEEQAINLFYQAVRRELKLDGADVEIVFINDGSSDRTAEQATALAQADELVLLINFSRNFGKEPALFAGLEYATGDAVIPMDVDLQDPISVIPLLIEEWQKGADVVLAKRRDRTADGYLKRHSAALFYHLLNRISYTRIEENVGDFRLMDRKVVDVIRALARASVVHERRAVVGRFQHRGGGVRTRPAGGGEQQVQRLETVEPGAGRRDFVQHGAAAFMDVRRRRVCRSSPCSMRCTWCWTKFSSVTACPVTLR